MLAGCCIVAMVLTTLPWPVPGQGGLNKEFDVVSVRMPSYRRRRRRIRFLDFQDFPSRLMFRPNIFRFFFKRSYSLINTRWSQHPVAASVFDQGLVQIPCVYMQ